MSNRRKLGWVFGASVLALPVGTLWAFCGLAECDRADCGPILNALYLTSGIGVIVFLLGAIGTFVSGIALLIAGFRH